jgi:hypothetical protein
MAFAVKPGGRCKELYLDRFTVPTFKETYGIFSPQISQLIMFRKIIVEGYCFLGYNAV